MPALLSGLPSQQRRNRDIFVDIFPMNADAARDQSPVFALLRHRLAQTREPFQGHRYLAAVRQTNDQGVLGESDCLGQRGGWANSSPGRHQPYYKRRPVERSYLIRHARAVTWPILSDEFRSDEVLRG